MVSTAIPLALPLLPNFLRMAPPNQDFTVDVANLSDDTLRQIGAEWTEALVKHAAARRNLTARQEAGRRNPMAALRGAPQKED